MPQVSMDAAAAAQASFYTQEEARGFKKDFRFMAADNNGQWATAAVDSLTQTGLLIKWTQWPKHPPTPVPFEDADNRLNKAETPAEANKMAQVLSMPPPLPFPA